MNKIQQNKETLERYSKEKGMFLGLPIFNSKNHDKPFTALLFELCSASFFAIFSYLLIQLVRFWIFGDWSSLVKLPTLVLFSAQVCKGVPTINYTDF